MTLPDVLPIPARPLSTKEGWRDFVARRPSRRPHPPANGEKLSEQEQRRLDRARHRHHESFGPILTPEIRELLATLQNLALSNLGRAPGARPGAVIDGVANLGKTTVLAHFGRQYELTLRADYGEQVEEALESEWHPVVYHTLTAQATVRSLAAGIADYYGVPMSSRATAYEFTRAVVRCAQECATTVFLIDDIHYLDMRHEGAREVNNYLKQLANETSATFVYAGIGCEESGLLTEGKARGKESYGQTRGRFTHLPMKPFGTGTPEERQDWLGLVKAFEDQLVLHRGHEGMCTGIAPYLHERTQGFVGSLSNLIRQGAAKAIENGEERITKALLNKIKLDYAVETGRAEETRKNRKNRRRGSIG